MSSLSGLIKTSFKFTTSTILKHGSSGHSKSGSKIELIVNFVRLPVNKNYNSFHEQCGISSLIAIC